MTFQLVDTVKGPEGVAVNDLRYKECFTYGGNLYMRVDSHSLKIELEKRYSFSARTRTQSLNTNDAVIVLRLTNGKLSYFKRTTVVNRVIVKAVVEEDKG